MLILPKDSILLEDGRRAYRLKMRISDCPLFDDPIDVYVWKTGFRSARDDISTSAALATLENITQFD